VIESQLGQERLTREPAEEEKRVVMNVSGPDATPLAKGVRVQYSRPKPDEAGLRGEIVSDGVGLDGRCVVRWEDPERPRVSWTLLEDARQLIPVRLGA
jgi:hypothetical protein